MKAEIKVIPIVICRAGTFNVKTIAEIAQLISFKKEPLDALTYKQLPKTEKKKRHGTTCPRTRMALAHLKNLKVNPHHKGTHQAQEVKHMAETP